MRCVMSPLSRLDAFSRRALARCGTALSSIPRALTTALFGDDQTVPAQREGFDPLTDESGFPGRVDTGGPPVVVVASAPGGGRTTRALAHARMLAGTGTIAVVDAEYGLVRSVLDGHELSRPGVVVLQPPTPLDGWDMVHALVDAVDVLVIDGVDALFVDRLDDAPRVSVEQRILDVVARARVTAIVMTVWRGGIAERACATLAIPVVVVGEGCSDGGEEDEASVDARGRVGRGLVETVERRALSVAAPL
jgi:hypothetical protein